MRPAVAHREHRPISSRRQQYRCSDKSNHASTSERATLTPTGDRDRVVREELGGGYED